MNYLQKAVLDKYAKHWYTLRDAGFISNLKETDVIELQTLYQQLIEKHFFVNKWCNSCVAEMLRILYVATKYDELKFTDGQNVKEFIEELDEAELTEEKVVTPEPSFIKKKRGRKKKS